MVSIHKTNFRNAEGMASYILNESIEKERRRVPAIVYKYLKKEHAENLLSKGQIRIGTLFEYKNNEEEIERHDANEGFKELVLLDEKSFEELKIRKNLTAKKISSGEITPLNQELLKDNSEYKKLAYKYRENFIGKINFNKDNNKVLFEHADIYVFCTTKTFDINVMKSFNCDACIKIFYPHLFFSYLTKGIRTIDIEAEGYDWGLCRYLHPLLSLDPECPEYLMKHYDYSHQQEFRFCWLPYDKQKYFDYVNFSNKAANVKNRSFLKKIKPMIINVPEITNFCERII